MKGEERVCGDCGPDNYLIFSDFLLGTEGVKKEKKCMFYTRRPVLKKPGVLIIR